MPTVVHRKREVLLKIVYYGPGLGGKTTNLEYIHANSRPDLRGKLLSLTNETERTLFFDLLPLDLGEFMGYSMRLHVCTVPGQVAFDRTRRLILRGVDGVVFVVDSQPAQLEANIESLENLATNLRALGVDPDHIPVVVQYNKRDIDEVLSVEDLRFAIGIPDGVPQLEASALYGQGVFDTLKRIVRECMRVLGDPRRAREGRTPSILPGRRASMYPGALDKHDDPSHGGDSEVSRRTGDSEVSRVEVPRGPRVPTDVGQPARSAAAADKTVKGSAQGDGGR